MKASELGRVSMRRALWDLVITARTRCRTAASGSAGFVFFGGESSLPRQNRNSRQTLQINRAKQ